MKKVLLRHRIRALTTTLFLVTFPVSFYYLSPMVPIVGSLEGIVTGSLLVFLGLFLVSMVVGRGFCAYLCPAGTMQDQVRTTRSARFPRRFWWWTKFLVWGVWIGMLVLFFQRAGGIRGGQFGFLTEYGFSVTDVSSLIIYMIVLAVILVFALLFGRRAACHTICWMAPFMVLGSRFGRVLKIPALRVTSKSEDCISCGVCTQQCPMSLEVQNLQTRGVVIADDCILCGECIDSCPKKILKFGWW